MTNIELKEMDGFYHGITENFSKGRMFLNLDLIFLTEFSKLESNEEIYVEGEKTTVPKDSHKITLIFENGYNHFTILIDNKIHQEYERIRRILTDKLCVK